jgi:hypothetical protein
MLIASLFEVVTYTAWPANKFLVVGEGTYPNVDETFSSKTPSVS